MTNRLQSKLIAAWILAAIMIGVGGLGSLHQYGLVSTHGGWVSHTRDVMEVLERILAQNWRAESNLRAYKISNDPKFLTVRTEAIARIRKLLVIAADLTSDNLTQQENLKTLEGFINDRLKLGDQSIAMQKHAQVTRSATILNIEQGAGASAKIEKQIEVMQAEETTLLAERVERLKTATGRANFALTVTSIFAVLCIAAAIWLTVAYLKEITRLERRFRGIFDGTFQFMAMLSPEGKIIDTNRALLEFFGGKQSDLGGTPFWQAKWWGTADGLRQTVQAAVETAEKGGFTRFEAELLGKEDNFVCADVSIKPITDEKGKIAFLIAEGRDITERVQAESTLKASESRMQLVLDCVAEGIYQIDTQNNVVFINKAALVMLEFSTSEMIGNNVHELIHSRRPDGTPFHVNDCPLMQVTRTGENCRNSQDWFIKKDGTFFPVEYVSSPLLVEGEIIGAVVAFQDITQRKDTETRVSEFYSMVSHELRTPLTSIRGALRLMEGGKAGQLSDRAKQLVAMGRDECERLVRLINDILDIRKIEAGKLELKLEALEVGEVVEKTLANLHSLAAEHNVKLVKHVRDKATIMADRDRLTQILTNLVSNAIKFSPKEDEVIVEVAATETNVIFAVVDHGPGISKRDQDKLFKVFQQIDSTDARPKGGTGLGLAISEALVRQHHGQIGVESDTGKGSTFWFKLPIGRLVSMVEPGLQPQLSADRPEILIVEDDDALTTILYLSLVDQFAVKRASNLKEAETLLKSMKPKAILMDVHLPDGNGLDLMERVRNNTETQDIPCIVMSGSDPKSNKFSHPLMFEYLQKPFMENALIQSLNRALKYKPKRQARAIIVEDDAATREVIKDQLTRIGVDCRTASSGAEGVELVMKEKFDLMVLDLGLPDVSGNMLVDLLKEEGFQDLALLVYTARDLSAEEKSHLTLGVTRHLTKSIASEEQFISVVREMLNQLVQLPGAPGSNP